MTILHDLYLYLRLFWNCTVFWTFPTPEETYYSNIGAIYFQLGKYQKAISCFLKSEQSHHHREVTYSRYNSYFLGYSYLNLGDLNKAIEYLQRYAGLVRDDAHTTSLIGWCYAVIRELDSAVRWYKKAISLNPDTVDMRVECARILDELGRREEALAELTKAKEISANPLLTQIIEVLSHKAGGNIERAIELLKKMISDANTPWDTSVMTQVDAHFMLSGFQREYGDLEGTLTNLETAFKSSPNELRFINDLALEYADQGVKLEDALNLINRALRSQPSNAVFLSTKGSVLSKIGRREEAKAVLEKCLELLPDNEEIREQYRKI